MATATVEKGTTTWHRTMFDEFVRNELAVGGPDPHMRYVGYCVFPYGWQEIVWRLGVYVAVYNFATAEVIWQSWSADRMAREPDTFRHWIKGNWSGLKLRRERRAVRTPEKLVRCMTTYAEWAREALPVILRGLSRHDPERNYHMLWDEADKGLYGFGRYALTKLLEVYRRYADVNIVTPDIRPNGGYSPRLTLNLLSDAGGPDAHDNRRETIQTVLAQSEVVQQAQAERTGIVMDRFRFEVMLCEYRQSYERERQYPGRSIDSEMEYWDAISDFWGGADRKTQMWEARAAVTLPRTHGEIRGWRGTREDLGPLLLTKGVTWSDLIYDYPIREGPSGTLRRWEEAHSASQLTEMAKETLESRW